MHCISLSHCRGRGPHQQAYVAPGIVLREARNLLTSSSGHARPAAPTGFAPQRKPLVPAHDKQEPRAENIYLKANQFPATKPFVVDYHISGAAPPLALPAPSFLAFILIFSSSSFSPFSRSLLSPPRPIVILFISFSSSSSHHCKFTSFLPSPSSFTPMFVSSFVFPFLTVSSFSPFYFSMPAITL